MPFFSLAVSNMSSMLLAITWLIICSGTVSRVAAPFRLICCVITSHQSWSWCCGPITRVTAWDDHCWKPGRMLSFSFTLLTRAK